MPRSRRWPCGLLGMLALVGVVESSVARRRFDFLDVTGVTWALGGRSVARESVRSEVLCFGDSLAKFGLDPGEIERATGKRAYNFAVNAGRAPVSYFLLRAALAAGSRPSAVLIDFEPNILSQGPACSPELWSELAGPRDLLELALGARDGRFLGRALLASFVPTQRYRGRLRDAALDALSGRTTSRAVAPSCRRDRGALLVPHADRPPVAVDPMNHAFFPGDWRCDPLNRRFARRFFALASAHGIPVFWVIPPYAPPIQALRERHGQDARFTRFALALGSRFPGVTVVDGRRSGHDASLFWDGTVHLDARGARALSADVAAVLNRSFAGEVLPRWVALPGARPHASTPQ